MSKVMITESYLEDIADAIRTKTGSSDTYKPAEMADAIEDIPGGITPSGTKQISITSNGTTTEDVTNYASVEIAVSVPVNLTLIGQKTFYLGEYTNTSTWEATDTEINIKDTDYAFIYGTITCDSAITTSTEWGITVFTGGRYTTNGNYNNGGVVWQKGSSTTSKSAMVENSTNSTAYGVVTQSNTSNIIIQRKAHATACPKIRAGNYTVKVYGITSI